MSEIELKACPFCGADGEFLSIEHLEGTILHPAYCVRCDRCGASSRYTDHDCREVWNERAPQWQPIESLVSDELVITWHDFGGINQNTTSPHYGKKGYSRIQQRFGGRLFPSEACETGFVSHWQPLPAPPEVEG